MNSGSNIEFARRSLLLGAAVSATAMITGRAEAADRLVVVVNSANAERLSASELAAIFTTRKLSWGGGKRIVAFNFPPKHRLRVTFDRSVLDMSVEDVARYWIDRRIRGGSSPPKQVANAKLLVRLVGKLDGAIAYVPRSEVNDTVRIVKEI